MDERYDIAQVCTNGHSANSAFEAFPQFNQDFCDKCGEKTITTCQSCETPIRGMYHGGFSLEYDPPAFCYKCGNSFPWTQRKIQAAIELAVEVGGLSGDDASQFDASIREISRDTPQTQVAAHRIKRLLGKFAKSTGNSIREVMVDIVSETAKKIIWPD
ncbi:MAG: DUF2321 domain-containing protein [Oryzomonas sp.]|jgi:hypothetical protein